MTDPLDDMWRDLRQFMPGAEAEKEAREILVRELAAVMGQETLPVAEGCLRVDVPLHVVIRHVPLSNLRAALHMARGYACLLVRAAAVTPEGVFRAWAHAPGQAVDLGGQHLELLPEGQIRCHAVAGLWERVFSEGVEEELSGGVDVGDAPRERSHRVQHEAAVERGVGREPGHVDRFSFIHDSSSPAADQRD
ncbi:hypothetical protein [Azorhizobium sp. AG788]|uniref:hypothetical protein n=1 Tax=Azorhizobium sp. AG788 TaxID=2183897 RepID=UPI003139D06A